MGFSQFSHHDPYKVLHITQPAFPEFRFEWHPMVKTVYFIRLGERTAHPFAQNADDEGRARMAVFIFLRGYREALQHPPIPKVPMEGNA